MRISLLLLGAVAGLVAPAAASASRVPAVRCGTVVEDVAVLDRDLRCEGVGVVLRNPRSVLELNGHTIVSTRSCADGAAPSGITVERTADGTQILGPGLVRGFVTGIAVDGAVRVQVRDVRVSDSCSVGVLALGTDGLRVRDAIFHRNGRASDEGGALRVEQSARFALEGSAIFANATGAKGAAVDLRDCDRCRVIGNRILANAGPGLRLDPESRAAILERNVLLDQRGADVVDGSSDGSYVFNLFERGEGLRPPDRWPPAGALPGGPSGPTGCGTMHALVPARTTVTLACPPAGGVRGVQKRRRRVPSAEFPVAPAVRSRLRRDRSAPARRRHGRVGAVHEPGPHLPHLPRGHLLPDVRRLSRRRAPAAPGSAPRRSSPRGAAASRANRGAPPR